MPRVLKWLLLDMILPPSRFKIRYLWEAGNRQQSAFWAARRRRAIMAWLVLIGGIAWWCFG